MTVRLVVSYDGTGLAGFQRQAGDLPTVQSELEAAASLALGERISLVGAGRTDAGVHARGQVVSFLTSGRIPIERLPYALNGLLPRTVSVLSAELAPPGFCARRSAKSKVYSYQLYTTDHRRPLLDRHAWHCPGQLDREAVDSAARLLVGTHDFRAFSRAGSSARTTVRTLSRVDCTSDGDLWRWEFEASGFLYAMARLLVGTLVAVGRNRMSCEAILTALESGERGTVGETAPPHGLCLERVLY